MPVKQPRRIWMNHSRESHKKYDCFGKWIIHGHTHTHTYIRTHIFVVLILILWHREVVSNRKKISCLPHVKPWFEAERCLGHRIASRLNTCSQTDWATWSIAPKKSTHFKKELFISMDIRCILYLLRLPSKTYHSANNDTEKVGPGGVDTDYDNWVLKNVCIV